MSESHVTMSADGSLVIPEHVRVRLGMVDGGAFLLHVEDGSLRLEPLAAVIRRVQAEVRRYVPEGADLAGELIEERRREERADAAAGAAIRPRRDE